MQSKRKILFLLGAMLSALAFLGFIGFLTNNTTPRIDEQVNLIMSQIQFPFFVGFAKFLEYLFDTLPLVVISLIITTYFWHNYPKLRKNTSILAFGMLFNAFSIYILKSMIMRERPLNALIQETSYSFPSGHSASVLIFSGLLIALLWDKKQRINKRIIVSGVILTALVAFSRVYLNTHWFTDVIGGLLLGMVWLCTSIALLEKTKR